MLSHQMDAPADAEQVPGDHQLRLAVPRRRCSTRRGGDPSQLQPWTDIQHRDALLLEKVPRPANSRVPQWISSVRMMRTAMNATLKSLGDQTLIEMTLAGHTGSFDALMDCHLPAIRKMVNSIIPNIAEAEDVVQEVQLRIWTHLSTLRSHSTFRTWATRIAINQALQSHRRAKAGRECASMNLDCLAACTESPFRSYARREMARTVRRAVRRLPAKFRQIVILRDLNELSVKETADHVNSKARTVTTRLFRARAMLSKTLEKQRKQLVPDWRSEIAA